MGRNEKRLRLIKTELGESPNRTRVKLGDMLQALANLGSARITEEGRYLAA
mgnify:CR=1 FL=1